VRDPAAGGERPSKIGRTALGARPKSVLIPRSQNGCRCRIGAQQRASGQCMRRGHRWRIGPRRSVLGSRHEACPPLASPQPRRTSLTRSILLISSRSVMGRSSIFINAQTRLSCCPLRRRSRLLATAIEGKHRCRLHDPRAPVQGPPRSPMQPRCPSPVAHGALVEHPGRVRRCLASPRLAA
jgi:hypothetical protein